MGLIELSFLWEVSGRTKEEDHGKSRRVADRKGTAGQEATNNQSFELVKPKAKTWEWFVRFPEALAGPPVWLSVARVLAVYR